MIVPTKSSAVTAAAVASATILILSGCSPTSTSAPLPDPLGVVFEHIHELEANPEDGTLLVATHEGLYRLTIGLDGEATANGPIGGLDFDPMSFTVVAGIAYASGHPGPTTPDSFGTPNLGLITSTDLGETWTNVSLIGTTDFHALTVMTNNSAAASVFGIDPSTQRLQRSLDGGRTWDAGAELVARDILAVGDQLYATTPDGLAVSDDDGTTFTVDVSAPALYLIAADRAGLLAGVDTTGNIWARGADGTWTMGGVGTGIPEAFGVDGDRIYVADDRGIALTENSGATWIVLAVLK